MKPNMTYNMIKTHFVLHQALHHSCIYNFTLNHNYKLKTIIVLKDVWIPKSKKIYVFFIFECFEHVDPFLWNILKFTKKLKQFYEHLIFKKTLKQKNPLVHMFFLSVEPKRSAKKGQWKVPWWLLHYWFMTP